MSKEVVTISIRKYAQKLNVDDKSVRNAIANGKIKKGVKYVPQVVKGKVVQVPQIIEAIADREYGDTKKVVKPAAGVSKAKVAEKLQKQKTQNQKNKQETKSVSPQDDFASDEPPIDLENLSYEELLKKINIHDQLPYNEIIKRRELLGAVLDKLKTQKELGILVEKEVIDKKLFDIGNRLKTNLQNIPNRVVALIRSSPNDVDGSNILMEEINQVLEEIATL